MPPSAVGVLPTTTQSKRTLHTPSLHVARENTAEPPSAEGASGSGAQEGPTLHSQQLPSLERCIVSPEGAQPQLPSLRGAGRSPPTDDQRLRQLVGKRASATLHCATMGTVFQSSAAFSSWKDYLGLATLITRVGKGLAVSEPGDSAEPREDGQFLQGRCTPGWGLMMEPDVPPKASGGAELQVCVFCRNNKETATLYRTHVLKGADGRVQCPVLRRYTCPLCGARGDQAHTIKYCPLSRAEDRAHTIHYAAQSRAEDQARTIQYSLLSSAINEAHAPQYSLLSGTEEQACAPQYSVLYMGNAHALQYWPRPGVEDQAGALQFYPVSQARIGERVPHSAMYRTLAQAGYEAKSSQALAVHSQLSSVPASANQPPKHCRLPKYYSLSHSGAHGRPPRPPRGRRTR